VVLALGRWDAGGNPARGSLRAVRGDFLKPTGCDPMPKKPNHRRVCVVPDSRPKLHPVTVFSLITTAITHAADTLIHLFWDW
jgi:hypothetical protein